MIEPEAARQLSPSHRAVYRSLVQAAAAGDICPTNEALRAEHGYASPSSPSKAIQRIVKVGLAKLEVYQCMRRITITATGQSTRLPDWKCSPHWRHR